MYEIYDIYYIYIYMRSLLCYRYYPLGVAISQQKEKKVKVLVLCNRAVLYLNPSPDKWIIV